MQDYMTNKKNTWLHYKQSLNLWIRSTNGLLISNRKHKNYYLKISPSSYINLYFKTILR